MIRSYKVLGNWVILHLTASQYSYQMYLVVTYWLLNCMLLLHHYVNTTEQDDQ